jgi:hypothetical protein
MKIQNVISSILFLAAVVFVAGTQASVHANNVPDAFVGTVEKIDAEAKLIYVKSKDGVVKAFKWTAKTTAHGIEAAAVWTDRAAHVGAHVVVRAVTIAGKDTIKGLHWFGHGTLKVIEGTVHYIEKNGKKVGHTVANEAREIYEVSEHAVINTGKTIGHGAKVVGKHVGKDVSAVIHTVESDGKKFVHFIEHKKKP